MKKAVIYTRVSTGSDNQASSLVNQEKHYQEWCEKHNYEMLEVYSEKGLSGTNARRPEFIRLMYDAGLNHARNENGYDFFEESNRKPRFNYIICKDVSRFSRNSHIGMLTIEYLRNKGVYVNFENSGLITDAKDWHMRASMLFTMAQFESENTSQRIKFTKRNNAKQGLYRPARLPYGYEWNETREIVINEEQAETVRFIFDRFENEGSHILTRKLNEKGISTQLGKKWSTDKILRIISNLIYTGTATASKSKKNNITDTKRVDIDEDKWIKIPDAVPAIVTLKEYEKLNKIRLSRVNKSTKKGRKPAKNDIYYEKLYCEKCGSRFVRHIGNKDKINYFCLNRRKGMGCDVTGISVNIVNGMFDQVGTSNLIDDMANHAGYNNLIKRITFETSNLTVRKNEITAKINKLEADNKNMLDAIKKGLAEGNQNIIEMFSDDIDKNKDKIKELSANRDKININSVVKLKEKVESKRKLIDSIKFGKEISKADKLALLKQIIVGDYECIIEFSFPNFEAEVHDFNAIFPMNEIQSVVSHSFTDTYRRNHKASREYWNDYDEANRDRPEYYYDNFDGIYLSHRENIGKDAIEMEKLLDNTNEK